MYPTQPTKEQIDSFFQQLRKSTAPMHDKLEENSLSKRLMAVDVSNVDYSDYLQKMKGVIAFTENNVFPLVASAITDTTARKKLPLLNLDLAFLKTNEQVPTLEYHPFNDATIGFALGYMYVVEGSILGGRVILKHLAPKLQIDENHGGSFFAGYKDETSSRWKNFLQDFGTYVVTNNCEEETILGAQDAFNTIYLHFES